MQHPILTVKINGIFIENRPTGFRLSTEGSLHSVIVNLSYPVSSEAGVIGDKVAISFSNRDSEVLLFSGQITDVGMSWAYRELLLSDGYQNICETLVTPAYRKEKASVILQDILDTAGISETAITCPDVELARFSTDEISVERCIEQLVKALEEHGFVNLRWFFDEKNVFHFGTLLDTGKNDGEKFEFESGSTIFRSGIDHYGKWIEVFPLSIRHSQKIQINGAEVLTTRTLLHISARYSRLKLWYEDAV
jgi:hypothetical protein